ncbi:MAG: phosphopantothenoylcysteine decarboxylase, partial [Pseudomonadota bacterium]
ENPDILATLSQRGNDRPHVVVGFAAETDDLVQNAKAKLARKGCDWLLANDVGRGTDTFGGDNNTIHWLTTAGDHEEWPRMSKELVAEQLIERLVRHFAA